MIAGLNSDFKNPLKVPKVPPKRAFNFEIYPEIDLYPNGSQRLKGFS